MLCLMVYHNRTVTCPHCKQVADRTRTVNSEILKGSPFRVCPHCKATYFDPEYKEMGLVLFEETGYEINPWSLFWFFPFNGMTIFVLYSLFKYNLFSDISYLLLPLGMFGIPAVLIDYGMIRIIKNRIHSDEFHQSQIDYIEGRTKERTASLVASMNRLSNKGYLDALKSHGVNVPDYFYERLQRTIEWSDK